MKKVENEKFIVRIHGEVNKEKILNACKTYCEKVELRKEKSKNNESV